MTHRPVLIVTGASRGLGRGIALAAATLGADLVLNARSAEGLQLTAQEVIERGGQAIVVPADIGHPDTAPRLVTAALEAYGRLDAVVNNAGVITPLAPIAAADWDAWLTNWQVNFLGAVHLVRHALPHLRPNRGRVINISSGAAIHAFPTWGAYCSAKAALNHFTAVLAREEPDITAIAFRPGVVDTDMQAVIREQGRGVMPPELHQRFLDYQAQGRLHPPEEVGLAVAHFALAAPHEWSGQFLAFYEEPARSWLIARGMAL